MLRADFRGLLADVNIQGHLSQLQYALVAIGIAEILANLEIELFTFPDFSLSPRIGDRTLWEFCQREGLALFTANRNEDGPDSLNATISEMLQPDSLPVLTLPKPGAFEHDPAYARRITESVAEVLFSLKLE